MQIWNDIRISKLLQSLILGGLCLPAPNIFAEPVKLTWEQCVAAMAMHNTDINASKNNLQSSEYLAQGARSGYYPQITGNLGYDYGNNNVSSSGNAAATGAYSASINVTQNLFNGMGDTARVQQASANLNSAAADLRSSQAQASYDLKFAYQGLLYAQNYLKLSADIVRRRKEDLRLVELRFTNGRENKGSVLLSQAYLAQANLSALQAENLQGQAQAQLAKVLGREAGAEIEVIDTIPVNEPDPQLDIRQLALQTPAHQQAVAKENAAQAGVQLARSALYPSLDLTGQYGKLGNNFFPDNERWYVGINLSIPIFNGGKNYYTSQSAQALYSAAAFNRDSVDLQLLASLKTAYHGYREAVQRLKVDESFYQAAVVRAQIAREQYNNGLISFSDWDLIENDLITRETNRLQSQRDRVIAEASWEQAVGKGVVP